MAIRDLATLLQFGFAGFAAAMAVLSYRLIQLEMKRRSPSINVIQSLGTFTRYTLYLSIGVLAANTIDRGFDYITKRLSGEQDDSRRRALIAAQHVQNCRESLSGLEGPEGASSRPAERLQEAMRLAYTKCYDAMQSLEEIDK
jgi:hypothetical protein